MNIDFGWIAWFFHGAAPVWIAVILCFGVMALCYHFDRVYILIGASALAILLMILGTCGGLYNLSRMERCTVCQKILPPEYAYAVCFDHIEMDGTAEMASAITTPTNEVSTPWENIMTSISTLFPARKTCAGSTSSSQPKPLDTWRPWRPLVDGAKRTSGG